MTTMIGLGVGIDYSLLIVTRFREELARGHGGGSRRVNTLATAGRAVITSGLTVVVGIRRPAADTADRDPERRHRRAHRGGASRCCSAITLLPALLAVLGREIDRPRWLARRLTWYHAPQVWEKWARTLSRHPIRALGYGGAVIGLLTLPVFFIKIGLPSRHWWPAGTEAGEGLRCALGDGRRRLHPAGARPGAGARRAERGRGDLAPRAHDADRLAQGRPAGARGAKLGRRASPRAACWRYSVLYSDLPAARARYPTSSTRISAATGGSP